MINDQDQSAGGVPDGGAVEPTAPDRGVAAIIGSTAVGRAKNVLRFDSGAFGEISSDPNGLRQGLVVGAVASFAASFWPALLTLVLAPVTALLAVTAQLIAVAILAGTCSLVARLYSARVPPYRTWLSAFLFAIAPIALGIIPFVGHSAGAMYSVILMVVAIQAVGKLPAAPAMAVFVLGSCAVGVLAWVVMAMLGVTLAGGLLSLIGLG